MENEFFDDALEVALEELSKAFAEFEATMPEFEPATGEDFEALLRAVGE